MTPAVVREGVQRALDRLRVPRIDLMQFHWWSFEHPAYLDAMLELARERLLELTQAEAFAPIYVRLAYTPSPHAP